MMSPKMSSAWLRMAVVAWVVVVAGAAANGGPGDGATGSGAIERTVTESWYTGSGAIESGATGSGATESGATESGATGSGASKSGVIERKVTESWATGSGAIESGAIVSETTEDEATENGATESGATENGATESGATESGATESGATESGATESGATESGATEGGATESGATESGATENRVIGSGTSGREAAGSWDTESGAAPVCGSEDCQHVGGGIGDAEHQYSVNGQTVIISYGSNYFHMSCYDGTPLDSTALPRFPAEREVSSVWLSRCSLPRGGGSLGVALAALNVSLAAAGDGSCALALGELADAPELAGARLAGLAHITRLRLTGGRAAADVLAPLPRLRSLHVVDAALPAAALELAPASLRNLTLHRTGLARLPAGVLALPELRLLSLVDGAAGAARLGEGVERARLLDTLTLDGPWTPRGGRAPAAPALRQLTLRRWVAARPAALERCDALEQLALFAPAAEELPPRWVAACGRLRALLVQRAAALTRLPPALLAGAAELRTVVLQGGALQYLPDGLFADTPKLEYLDISDNRLTFLPSRALGGPRALRELRAAGNALGAAAARALGALAAAAPSLRRLQLARNPLPDLCNSNYAPSKLSSLRNLEHLSLASTKISIICADWRTGMPNLSTLILENTNITTLMRIDLEFDRSVESTVWLTGANVSGILFDRSDWEAPAPYPGSAAVSVQLDARRALACDCGMYWTWRALRAGAAPLARVRPLRCAGPAPRALAQLREDELLCPAAGRCGALPAACACAHNAALLRVSCAGAALSAPPAALARLATRLDLLLPRNNLSSLRAADLPPRIRKLDLRNNSLSTLDAETALRILNASEVYISGNPWECGCEAAATLQLFRSHGGRLADYEAARCADGGALAAARAEPCRGPERALLAAALALLLPALAAAAALRNAESRQLARALLDRLGLWPRAAEDDECAYDAFVSFAHEDSAYAAELVRRLEPAYRLCLHYRDWEPGRWIPEQIARSVRASRRTVALLSAHSLRSAWARAEVREALALALRSARPRLLAVLLDAPERLPLDAELRRYLARHTYVRWHDPWFPHKLRLALPRPRARSPPPPPLYSVPLPGDPTGKPVDNDNDFMTIPLEIGQWNKGSPPPT